MGGVIGVLRRIMSVGKRAILLSDRRSKTPPCWTSSPHVEIGDTLFFYFIAPRKAIHFIGRAVRRPYIDLELEVMSHDKVDPHQWWVDYDAIVEIDPIPLSEIYVACGERLILRGRSGKPIRVAAANQLLKRAKLVYSSAPWCEQLAFEEIVGRSELPSPNDTNLPMLRDLPASLLRLESHVEEFVVEPLFRLLRLPNVYELKRRFRIGRKVADYAVVSNAKPQCIIETKLRTRLDRNRNWDNSPDIQQALGYANTFGIRFLVIDCDEIFCFDAGVSVPCLQLQRRLLTAESIAEVRSHIVGGE